MCYHHYLGNDDNLVGNLDIPVVFNVTFAMLEFIGCIFPCTTGFIYL